MKNIYFGIGAEIKALRLSLDLTQAQVAEAAKIDESFYGQIERGAAVPSVRTLANIAVALKVDLRDLFPSARKTDADPAVRFLAGLTDGLSPSDKKLLLGVMRTLCARLKSKR